MKEPSLLYPWRVFGFEVVLFSLSLGLGILAGLRLHEIFKIQKVPPPSISLSQFLFYFLFATIFLLLIIYFFKFKRGKGIFFKGIFLLAIGFGNFFFFGLWLPDVFLFILVVLLIVLLLRRPSLMLHNFALIFAIAGVGAGLGLSFTPEMVILLLLIFSIYDFIAVYKTKHMIKMAKEMIAHGAILGIVVPQTISDFQSQLKEVRVGGKFLVLGAGDIVFPLILVVSLIPQGIFNSLIVASFALLGLFAGFLIFISKKIRTPMPALPPIALFSIIGYLLTRII
ncbi:hypothetical protein KJA17_00515 [Patescibacteria group bacterium]|nr:hypothetical protein [Patescibacteria group bacterium]